MPFVQLIESFIAGLFGDRETGDAGTATEEFIGRAVELVVDATHPPLRLLPDYRQRLTPYVQRGVDYLRGIGEQLPPPFPLSRRSWASDPCANAFFATAADVDALLQRSGELHDFFAAPGNLACEEAYALLAMGRHERAGFRVQLEGEVLRHEVPVRSISFSDHQLLAPGADLVQARRAIGLRIFHTLADIALEQILQHRALTRDLEEDKALLATRLRQARARQGGLAVLCHDLSPCPDAAELERQLAGLDADLGRARASLATLDDYVHAIGSVIGAPDHHLGLKPGHLRIDRLGRLVDDDDAGGGPVNAFDCIEGELQRDGQARPFVLAIARCRRDELPPRHGSGVDGVL